MGRVDKSFLACTIVLAFFLISCGGTSVSPTAPTVASTPVQPAQTTYSIADLPADVKTYLYNIQAFMGGSVIARWETSLKIAPTETNIDKRYFEQMVGFYKQIPELPAIELVDNAANANVHLYPNLLDGSICGRAGYFAGLGQLVVSSGEIELALGLKPQCNNPAGHAAVIAHEVGHVLLLISADNGGHTADAWDDVMKASSSKLVLSPQLLMVFRALRGVPSGGKFVG
jgi:hypothetical protein